MFLQKTHFEYGGYFGGQQQHIPRHNGHVTLTFPNRRRAVLSPKTHLEYGGYFGGRQGHIPRHNGHVILAFPNRRRVVLSRKTHLEYGGYFGGRQRHISRHNGHVIRRVPIGDVFYYYKKLTLNTEGILVGGSGTSLGTMVT